MTPITSGKKKNAWQALFIFPKVVILAMMSHPNATHGHKTNRIYFEPKPVIAHKEKFISVW